MCISWAGAGCHAAMSIHSLPLPFIQSRVTMGPRTTMLLMSFFYVSRLMMGARALAKTGLIATMCLPTEQSPVHLGQRERKERAFPLRFFAFPDGCFARERAWIGATWKAPTRHVLCSFISRTRSLPGVSYAWTAAHREVSGRREWLCMMVWRITSARRPKFTVSSLLLLRPSTRPPYSRTVQAARCAIHPSIHPSR